MSVAVIYSPTEKPTKKQLEWESKKGERVVVHHLSDPYPRSFSSQVALQDLVFNGVPWDFDMLVVDKLEHLCLGGTHGLIKVLSALLWGERDLIVCNDPKLVPSRLPLWFLRRVMEYPQTVARERRSITLKRGREDDMGGRPRLDHVTASEIAKFDSVREAAQHLGCSERTIRNRLNNPPNPNPTPEHN